MGVQRVAPVGADVLSERAATMREYLQKSQSITDTVVSILGSFDHRLSALETAMRPTQIRTHAIRRAHENIDKTSKAAEVILAQFDLSRQAEAKILKGPHEDLESYLEAIEQLRSNIQFFSNNKSFKSSDGVLSHANNLLAKAIAKLEEEFKQLLSSYSKPVEPERLFEGLPNALRPSAESPGNQGNSSSKNPSPYNHHEHHKQPPGKCCLHASYSHTTANFTIAAQFSRANGSSWPQTAASENIQFWKKAFANWELRKLNKDDVQKMQWEVLEAKIGNWIHYMRIAVKLLFAGERKVCDQMFEGIDSLRDQCFAEVTASSLAVLLSFGDAIAKSKRSPGKVICPIRHVPEERRLLLGTWDDEDDVGGRGSCLDGQCVVPLEIILTVLGRESGSSELLELREMIETLFKGKACGEIRESALGLTKRLAQTAQETFGDFEEAVEKDATKTAVLDGTVHPLTSYVINYVKFLFDFCLQAGQYWWDAVTVKYGFIGKLGNCREGSVFKSPLVWGGEVGCNVPSTGDDCLDRSATVSDYFRWEKLDTFCWVSGTLLSVDLKQPSSRMVWPFPSIVIELVLVWRGAKSWQEKGKGLPFGAFAFVVDYLHIFTYPKKTTTARRKFAKFRKFGRLEKNCQYNMILWQQNLKTHKGFTIDLAVGVIRASLLFYQSTLKQLFQEFETGKESHAQLASVTMRIMQALQTNLDGKSKQYKDPALTNLFLMNNIHYMVRSVRRSEAKDLLGDDWVQIHRRIVQQHANQYKRIAWAKILQCLSIQGGLSSSGGGSSVGVDGGGNSSGVSRAIVKDRLKTFNIQFEELHQRQSQWTVPDSELRESLRLAVAEVLLPAYRSFIKRFGALVESGKAPQKYIRYSAEDLDHMLGEFFEGKTLNEPRR
ncbi:exocyst subunit exo70 family protein A1 [Actinidia rufa]|uniref:Exocyst subunit Exo70 family protein n=1 Tax=Actinidia rufa TaxID=165716 RepID=A0A7J0DAN7_9ERIC|nr:exocyst subunit exo70 family protein A1 [Actinidia rufa]